MTATVAPPQPQAQPARASVVWAALGVVILSGLLLRAVLLPTSGFTLDLVQHFRWAHCGLENGVFGVYVCAQPVTHPPLSPTMLTASLGVAGWLGYDIAAFDEVGAEVVALKVPNLLFELGILALVGVAVWRRAGLAWATLAVALLGFNLGWLVVTAWWGQNDATYTFFVLAAALLLEADRPRAALLAYGVAGLAKFQAVMFGPVLAVLVLRRWGWRVLLQGVGLALAVFLLGMLPFVVGSGRAALGPFLDTVGLFPFVTQGAHNVWYWALNAPYQAPLDTLPLVGALTYRQAGLGLLALATLAIAVRVWRHPWRRDVPLLMAVACIAFFMLPTQMQSRYLYAGVVFLLLAACQARDVRLLALYVALALPWTYNILDNVEQKIGLLYWPRQLMLWPRVANGALLTLLSAAAAAYALAPLLRRPSSAEPPPAL